jgi:hypothetical protein
MLDLVGVAELLDALDLFESTQIATAGRYEGDDWSLVYVTQAPQYH